MHHAERTAELRILLVEDNEHDCIAFKRAMRACTHSHAIQCCERASEALAVLADTPQIFDIIVVDYNLPGDNGLMVCRTVLERGHRIPVVLLTGSGNEQIAVEALKLGIADYIIKDPDEGYLKLLPTALPQIVSNYLAREAARRAGEALREAAEHLAQIVNGISVAAFVIDREHIVTHWNRACAALTGTPPSEIIGTRQHWRAFYPTERPTMADLILDNAIERDVDRYYHGKFQQSALIEGAYEAEDFFANFGEHGRWLFFTASPVRDAQGQIIGAIETLQDVTERRLAEDALKESEARFRELSITDGLTGLYNSRHFFERIEAEASRAERHDEPLCLLLMDVDNFKRFNDSHGHLEGDRVLKVLAAAIHREQRISDIAFRYGGEEFVVLLPNTGMADALTAAERLRQRFAGEPIHIASGAASFIRRADEACYRAKSAGKNCVTAYAAE
jgi:diguanylate cyclase (GGDEF)-like protein/PAS domain S-box-containing protein